MKAQKIQNSLKTSIKKKESKDQSMIDLRKKEQRDPFANFCIKGHGTNTPASQSDSSEGYGVNPQMGEDYNGQAHEFDIDNDREDFTE